MTHDLIAESPDPSSSPKCSHRLSELPVTTLHQYKKARYLVSGILETLGDIEDPSTLLNLLGVFW